MIPLTPIYFTTGSEYPLPKAGTPISFLLVLRFDQIYIPILVDAQGTQSRSKKTFWQKELFSLNWSQSFLLEGKGLFPFCILGMSHRQLLHNQDTSSLSTNLRTALPKKYLLTFHYFYSLKYQAGSFLLEVPWYEKHGTYHRHIYSHLSMNEKS